MKTVRLYTLVILLIVLLAACLPVAASQQISISIQVDGGINKVSMPSGSSVREALAAANIELGNLDRTEPASYAQLEEGDQVRVIRITEEFETDQVAIPFISRTLPNEGLPTGEQRLIQNGANGLKEVHYRLLYEDGQLVSRTEIDSAILVQPVEEIIMLGAQSPFSSVPIVGRLAFLSAGNAWVLEGTSGARRAVATTGDLDGRIFEVSPDGRWLLFSRAGRTGSDINELWVASLGEGEQTLIDLHVSNVIHYAGWVQDTEYQIAFSTVEPVLSPPGWQANNDLQVVSLSSDGEVDRPQAVLSSREDGFYAWWGTDYVWSPSGDRLAFSRPDAVGIVDLDTDSLDVWYPLTAYQTGSDWAWIPGISWLDDATFYYVRYSLNPPAFSLVLASQNDEEEIAADVGMFAAPAAEPDGGQVAYLRAFTPPQSDISTYELMVAAPSGVSTPLFPPEGAAGLQPQRVAWSPSAETGPLIAFVYEGNLWVVNVLTSEAQQLTGDGLVSAISWR
ncbi:MAG: G5 domain-containing protein [Chloroflexi bacterium]|nr:G5 domain-containing protein [Chloroflexota bacterium]